MRNPHNSSIMNKLIISALLTIGLFLTAHAQNDNHMTPQQQSLVTIAAYEATGNIQPLYSAIGQALDNGLTINQLKDAFTQLYAYTGFPRSLNALTALQQVLSERQQAGIHDVTGESASPLPADYDALRQGTDVQTQLCGAPYTYTFAPDEDYYLKAHLFGDIFARDLLSWQQRELLTISALAAMNGTQPQLAAHKQIAQRTGLSAEIVNAAVELAQQLTTINNVTTPDSLPFPIGQPNDAYAQYFIGHSYLATVTNGISNVTFEPGCRNNWHIHHDARQILICVAGEGWYQGWGKPAQRLHVGDVIDIPTGVKHWHGATRQSWFQHLVTHIPAQPADGDNKTGNEWLEPVNDNDYPL